MKKTINVDSLKIVSNEIAVKIKLTGINKLKFKLFIGMWILKFACFVLQPIKVTIENQIKEGK